MSFDLDSSSSSSDSGYDFGTSVREAMCKAKRAFQRQRARAMLLDVAESSTNVEKDSESDSDTVLENPKPDTIIADGSKTVAVAVKEVHVPCITNVADGSEAVAVPVEEVCDPCTSSASDDAYPSSSKCLKETENEAKRLMSNLASLKETIRATLEEINEIKYEKNESKRKTTGKGKKKVPVKAPETIEISDEEIVLAPLVSYEEDVNPLVTVKVFWRLTEVNRFEVRKFQKLDSVLDFYVKKTGKDPKLLLFTLGDDEISLKDSTYDSLKLSRIKFIEGGILPDKYLTSDFILKPKDEDCLIFTVQFEARRNNTIKVSLRKDDKMNVLLGKVCEEFQVPSEKCLVYFDGERVKPDQTIESLELEGGECFDFKVKDS